MRSVIIISFLFTLSAVNWLQSQNYIQFSQFANTQNLVNPASNGTKFSTSGILLYRNQWINMKGAPLTFAFNINSPLKAKKMGVGMTVINEHIGMKSQTNINFIYSYITHISSSKHLSFGLSLGVKNYSFNKSEAQLIDSDDPFFSGNNESYLLPDFGCGTYYFTKKYFAGLSLPGLLSQKLDIYSTKFKTNSFSLKHQHYYLYSGYFYKINDSFLVKSSVVAKYLYGAPLQLNIGFSALIQELIWLGVGYRTGDALIFTINYKISNQIMLVYSYDWSLNKLNQYNSGSHEIIFSFNINKKPDNPMFNSPRRF